MKNIVSFGEKFVQFESIDELTDVIGDLMDETITRWNKDGLTFPCVLSESLIITLTDDDDEEIVYEEDLTLDFESWSKEKMVEITTKHKYYDC